MPGSMLYGRAGWIGRKRVNLRGSDNGRPSSGLLSHVDWEAANALLVEALRARIKGVTGATEADLVWVSALEVGGMAAGPLPIVVLDAELSQADGLLGRDFLSLFTVTIDTTASLVTLTRR